MMGDSSDLARPQKVQRMPHGAVLPDGTIGMNGESPVDFSYIERRRLRRMMEIIHAHPAQNIAELAKELGVFRTAAKHHIARLKKQELVVTLRVGRHLLHFDSRMSPAKRESLALLRLESIRRLCEHLLLHPAQRTEDIAQGIGLGQRTVQRALKRLQARRLVARAHTPDGQAYVLHPELRTVLLLWASPQQTNATPPLPESLVVLAFADAIVNLLLKLSGGSATDTNSC